MEVYIVWFTDTGSYHSTRQFKAVALSEEDARQWIFNETNHQHKTTTSYAKMSVDEWLKWGFSIEPKTVIHYDRNRLCTNPECPATGACGGQCINDF